jgi:pilus assembly protein CpaE
MMKKNPLKIYKTQRTNDIEYCNDLIEETTNSKFKSTNNKIISIVSNKGGVGKTSIAFCAALYFSIEMKKRTLLLELDCSPGDFGPLFDIDKDMSLEMAVRFPNDYKKYIKVINKNIDVLKGMPDPIIAESINSDSITQFFTKISHDYEYIIIDTQTVLNGMLIDALKLSNQIMIISNNSIESIARISKFLEILIFRFMIEKSKFKIIINKKKIFSFLKVWEISKIINFPINAFIHYDKKFNKSLVFIDKRKLMSTKVFRETKKILKNMNLGA